MVYRSALAIALAFALTACGQSTQAPPAPAVPQLQWTSVSNGEGSALLLHDGDGATVLNLACLYAPERMRITVSSFTKIGSEERLSFGAGDEPFVFVAQLDEAEPGVSAEREVSLDLVERLLNADAVSANYGAQNAGPFVAPPREEAELFATTCREIAG